MMVTKELIGFGGGARTATAKVGKPPDPLNVERLIGFETGARAVTAKVGKLEPAPADATS